MSTSSSVANASDLASGYNPLYTGIYIQTPLSKTQIRLFDYVDLVTKKDSVDVVDIDRDGDLDYIYMLGGSLYVKYSHQIDSPRSFETAITTATLDI